MSVLSIIIIGVLCVLLAISVYGNINLIKQTEQLESYIVEIRLRTYNAISNSVQRMRQLDIKGAFESDDEVGVVFTELKNQVELLNTEIGEFDGREQTNE